MALIVVTSAGAGEGKTGVAAAIARHYAYQGVAVRVARLASEDPAAGPRDAAYYAALDFVPGNTSATLPAVQVSNPPAGELLVIEAGASDLASLPPAQVVFVTRDAVAAVPDGVRPAAVVHVGTSSRPAQGSGGTAIRLPDDRTLAGFSVSEIQVMLRAETLVEGENGDPTCDYLVVAPFGSDAGQPYFRRFPSKAVVGRFDRTDMHLAAIRADADVLVLTGGRHPSDYVFDAARATGIPVLLSATDTENTVIALEGIWDRTRFQGDRKLDRMASLLEASTLFEALEV
ncbi:MAG: DRTGG domain-containing protein [Tepidiformaceae bacterium]